MTLGNTIDAAGGLALFLLAMLMMTEGLKVFAGAGLRRLLERWTSTPLRGVCAGMLVTGLVQSSGAVTVATIGFVNAGIMNLRQALGVVFGTNIGTTMTGWLVSLVGFGFAIERLALPILTVGVGLRLLAGPRRWQALGDALAGFGLFFLGLGILQAAFADLATTLGDGARGGMGWPGYLGLGFAATVLTQSSSAAIAIVLTAASGGVVALDAAAVAVIGANLGSTSTAAFAALRATAAARRLTVAHIGFNVVTAVVALAILPLMLRTVAIVADWLDVEQSPAAFLALFHTTFNLLGVALMLPLAATLARVLERLFRGADDDLAQPRYLDRTVAATPALAIPALHQELTRLRGLITRLVATALGGAPVPTAVLERQAGTARQLGEAITRFIASIRRDITSQEVAHDLAQAMRTARYLEEVAHLAPHLAEFQRVAATLPESAARGALAATIKAAADSHALASRASDAPGRDAERVQALTQFNVAYETAKTALLQAAVNGVLSVEETDALLDHMSASRRLVEQLVKADRLLRSPSRADAIEAEAPGNTRTTADTSFTHANEIELKL